jgi:tetratricopeptide (TPR) repeat protein
MHPEKCNGESCTLFAELRNFILRTIVNRWQTYFFIVLFVFLLMNSNEARSRSDGSFPGKGSYTAWVNANQFLKFGNDFAAKGDLDRALDCYKKAIHTYAYDSVYFFNLGNAFSRKSQFAIAEEAYQKAIELEPDYFQARLNLGHTQAKLGRPLEAAATLKRAAKLSQNPEEKEEIEKTIEQFKQLPAMESPPSPEKKKKEKKHKKDKQLQEQIMQDPSAGMPRSN